MIDIDTLLSNEIIPKDITIKDIFFYDETNNIRKFILKQDGFNNDLSNSYFVLGGLIIKAKEKYEIEKFIESLRLQKNINEIKFKTLAGKVSNFKQLLSNQRISTFIEWIYNSNIYVHYTSLNFIYYSLADIVDSLGFDDIHMNTLYRFHGQLKSVLYSEVMKDLDAYIELLFKYGYPNIEKQRISEFMSELYNIYYSNYNFDNNPESFFVELLRQMLKTAKKTTKLAFLHDNKPFILIDDFTSNYVLSMTRFPNATHIFDNEFEIAEKLKKDYINLESRINYSFIDSNTEIYIQLSDIFVGIISKFLTFIESNTDKNLYDIVDSMSNSELKTQRNLIQIIIRSERYSKYTTSFIGSLITVDKWNRFNKYVEQRYKSL